MDYKYTNYSDALIEDVSLKEYTNLQGWQDEIDQIQTEEDAKKIPQWVLDELGLTRDDIMPRKSYSNKPSDPVDTSTSDYADKEAADKFWGNATKKLIDIDNFHKAFDANLKDMNFDMNAFNADGLLVNQGTYGKIKSLDPNNNATKAIKRLWGLQFKEQGKLADQSAAADPAKKNVDEPQFIKDVEELIFDAMPNINNKTAQNLIDQRGTTGYRISYNFKFDSTGKVVWDWYDDDYDWPHGYKYSVDLGYDPFTKSEAEVAADIMIAIENNEINKE